MNKHLMTGTLLLVTCAGAAPAMAQQSCVRVAHMSPDTAAIDVYFDGVELFDNVNFRTFESYVDVAPGGYRVQITEADNPSEVLYQVDIRTAPNRSYTVAAVGRSERLNALLFQDASQPTPPGFAIARLMHVSPDAPVVDVTRSDGVILADDLATRTATDYAEVPVGQYTIQSRDQMGNVLADWLITVEEGTVVTGAATGLAFGTPALEGVIVTDYPNDCSLEHHFIDYSGMWFDPAQNGQGVQLIQNGTVLQGSWYVYDEMGLATFYTFSGTFIQGESFNTELLAWTGPAQGSTWDTALLNPTPAGTVSIDFETEVLRAELSWSVTGGAGGTLDLVPYLPPPAL